MSLANTTGLAAETFIMQPSAVVVLSVLSVLSFYNVLSFWWLWPSLHLWQISNMVSSHLGTGCQVVTEVRRAITFMPSISPGSPISALSLLADVILALNSARMCGAEWRLCSPKQIKDVVALAAFTKSFHQNPMPRCSKSCRETSSVLCKCLVCVRVFVSVSL